MDAGLVRGGAAARVHGGAAAGGAVGLRGPLTGDGGGGNSTFWVLHSGGRLIVLLRVLEPLDIVLASRIDFHSPLHFSHVSSLWECTVTTVCNVSTL